MDHLCAVRVFESGVNRHAPGYLPWCHRRVGRHATSEVVLIDMAATASANVMRVQLIVGNTSLLIEAELFGQPSLRANGNKLTVRRQPRPKA
jgi:hypothetical protein